MLKTILLLLLPVAFFSGSHQQCFSNNDNVGPPSTDQYLNHLASNKNFSLTMLKALYQQTANKDVVFSPSSIREALLLLYFGAARRTEESLARALQIPAGQTKALTWKIYRDEKTMNVRIDLTAFPLKRVNKLYLSHNVRLRPCMKQKFAKEIESINIEKEPGKAMREINEWVREETDGEIQGLVKKLDKYTTSAIVSAVTFNANWLSGFDPNNNQVLGFYGKGYTKEIYMVKDGTFERAYSQELRADLLLIRHELSRSAMIVVFPYHPFGLDEVIRNMDQRTLDFITNEQNYKSSNFRLMIPKITKRSNVQIQSVLQKLGFGNAFTTNADFSGFTGKRDVYVTELVHEASARITAEGSKVSVGSGSTFEERSGLNWVPPYVCDHSFLYMMYDFFGGKVLLMGTFSGSEP